MTPKMQNPGGLAGASRNQLGGWLHSPSTVSDWRVQMLASRFFLPSSMAREVCALWLGEAAND